MSLELLSLLGQIRDERVRYINVRINARRIPAAYPMAFLTLVRDSPWRMVAELFELGPGVALAAPVIAPKPRPAPRLEGGSPWIRHKVAAKASEEKAAEVAVAKLRRSLGRRSRFYNADDLEKGYAWLQGRAVGVGTLRALRDPHLPSLDDYDNRPRRRRLGDADQTCLSRRLEKGFDLLGEMA